MLPESEYSPAGLRQPLICVTVPGHIPGNLVRPVAGVGLRRDIVLRASVPVAAVDEDSDLRRAEDHVSRAAKAGERLGPDPVPQSLCVDEPSDQPLGLRVPAADRLHVPAAGSGGRPGASGRRPALVGTGGLTRRSTHHHARLPDFQGRGDPRGGAPADVFVESSFTVCLRLLQGYGWRRDGICVAGSTDADCSGQQHRPSTTEGRRRLLRWVHWDCGVIDVARVFRPEAHQAAVCAGG